MKKTWAIRKDAEGVSPVIATILMVAITVVLAAVLYVMVLGFGGTQNTPNVQILSKSTITGGYQVALTSPTSATKWVDVQVQLSVNGVVSSWDLKNIGTGTYLWSASAPKYVNMGASNGVTLNITDLAGDGQIGSGDSLTFTAASGMTTPVTLTLVYSPTGSAMMSNGPVA
jgi:flagellin-like protein